jgi:predicted Zn-dependent protease
LLHGGPAREALAQIALEDLAGHVAGQVVHKVDVPGDLLNPALAFAVRLAASSSSAKLQRLSSKIMASFAGLRAKERGRESPVVLRMVRAISGRTARPYFLATV